MSLPSDMSTDLHLPALKLLDVSGNEINIFGNKKIHQNLVTLLIVSIT